MRVGVALALGVSLIAIAVVLVLSGAPPRVIGTNAVRLRTSVAAAREGSSGCQAGETLPGDTTAVRLSLEAAVGPRMSVSVRSGRRVLTRGTRGSGWTGAEVTVPVRHVIRTTTGVSVCFTVGRDRELVELIGERTSPAIAAEGGGRPLLGRVRIEYLAPGDRSWWSLASSVARRIGLGRAPSGTWVAPLCALLMLMAAAFASWLAIRELGTGSRERGTARPEQAAWLAQPARLFRRVPIAAWTCALVACLNAVCWSILSPPFQVPDETAHFAYVQQLAETQHLPKGEEPEYSLEEEVTLKDLHHSAIRFLPSGRTISSEAEERKLEHDLLLPLPRKGVGDAGTAASEPPLYYALETIPYELGSGGTLLDRLQIMRLFSALFAGLTALFAFLFLREAFPATPWTWTVGGLGVALEPLLGFMSGAVNPDAMLTAVSALLFYLLARAFRRGLTARLGGAIGVVTAVGLFTKLNFLGLVPGVIGGLIVLTIRAPSRTRRGALIAVAFAAIPALLYLELTSPTQHPAFGLVSSGATRFTQGGSLPGEVSYIWQFYLPRLPGMTSYFPAVSTWRQLWFNGFVGMYGWADTLFPGWVYDLALLPAGLIALLCLRELARSRRALRKRTAELLVYGAVTVGAMALVGADSYINDVLNNAGPYWEPRYVLPLLALFAAVLVLAARGAGRRWGPAAGVLIVLLILAQDLFSQLLVISRFYS